MFKRLTKSVVGQLAVEAAFYPCEPLKKIGGNLPREGSFKKVFALGRKLYGDIPDCHGISYCFGNVFSSYFVKEFRGLAGDTIR